MASKLPLFDDLAVSRMLESYQGCQCKPPCCLFFFYGPRSMLPRIGRGRELLLAELNSSCRAGGGIPGVAIVCAKRHHACGVCGALLISLET